MIKDLKDCHYVASGLVLEIAKMVDPGAFSEWYDGTGKDAKLHEPTVAVKHARATAVSRTWFILKKLMDMKPGDIRRALIEDEMAGWRDLGVPVDLPELAETVKRKYAR